MTPIMPNGSLRISGVALPNQSECERKYDEAFGNSIAALVYYSLHFLSLILIQWRSLLSSMSEIEMLFQALSHDTPSLFWLAPYLKKCSGQIE
jgi:hypothetical protein